MKKSLFLILHFTFYILHSATAQTPPWKPITQQNKPWTRWWWEGSAVNKKDLTINMEKYQKAGLGGLEVTPIYGVFGAEKQFIEFLSPKWMDMLKHTINEGKRLNLGIDVANASGWPFGGRWITNEDACKYVTYKTYQLKEGEKLQETIKFTQEPLLRIVGNQFYSFGESTTSLPPASDVPNTKAFNIKNLKDPIYTNDNLQALAIDQVRFEKPLPLQVLMAYSDNQEKIDLTSKVDANGNLNWQAPKGNWKLYAVFQGWHGKMVERAGPGGEGNVIDHFSKKATDVFLTQWTSALQSSKTTGIRAFFNDSYEVDDAKGQANWTPELFTEFEKRCGYDLKNYLPELFSKTPLSNRVGGEVSHRVLSDYRETIADLLLEKYTKVWADWAHKNGTIVRNQAHGSPANILDLYATVDIPEIEGTDIYRIKFAPSAANITGKKLISSESATWENDHFLTSLSDAKKALDLFFLGGVNHVFYHGTNYSPPSEPFPGWMFYAATHFFPNNPFWNDFSKLNQYVARTQSFLQTAKPNNDVLLYFPIYDKFAHPSRDLLDHFDGIRPEFANSDFEANAKTLQERGFAFDFISDKQILNLVNEKNTLKTGGVNYQTLVLSNVQFIPLETWKKLVSLAQNGATIVCYKNLPDDVNGLHNLAERQAEFKKIINDLSFSSVENGIQETKLGKGKILISNDLEQVLTYTKVRRESFVEQNLQFNRRKSEKATQYFIVNRNDAVYEGWLPLAVEAKSAAIFNPMTEKTGFAQSRINDGKFEVFVSLQSQESFIIEAYTNVLKGSSYPFYEALETKNIEGNWNITFKSGGPVLPKSITTDNLVSWAEFEGDDYKNFSGTAVYSIDFRTSNIEQRNDGVILKFEKVHESARIRLNGKEIAVLIGPAYEVFIPKTDLKENNKLEVEVSNLMANRMAYMDRNNLLYKKFYNVNFPARFKENRDENGIFTAKNWLPKPSGIVGKVSLSSVRKK